MDIQRSVISDIMICVYGVFLFLLSGLIAFLCLTIS